MPEVAEAVKAQMPKLYKLYFDNGAELLGTQSSETPTVQLKSASQLVSVMLNKVKKG